MDDGADFETRAVLPPTRARRSRLALLVPIVAFITIAWAGLSGRLSDSTTAAVPDATSPAATTPATKTPPASAPPATARPQVPATALGIPVHRLEDVRPESLARDDIVAVSGWFVTTAITDCPALAIIYRDGALPEIRHDIDSWAFCRRSGVLYASQPALEQRPPPQHLPGGRSNGLQEIAATLVVGVVTPPELQVVGADALQIVVLGRFVPSEEGCQGGAGCGRALVIDYLAWPRDVPAA